MWTFEKNVDEMFLTNADEKLAKFWILRQLLSGNKSAGLSPTTMKDAQSQVSEFVEIVHKESHTKLKGENNYFALVIYYTEGSLTLEVKNSWLNYGKWVRSTNDFTEIRSPNGLTMKAWGEYHITASGRNWSPTGTEGSFDIYTSDGQKVVYVYWDVSYGGTAEWKKTAHDSRFKVTARRIGESRLDVTMVIKYIGTEATEEAIA
ncbi:hypothetical protein SELMODRAFT_429335 [Selaginella moellendorffii]|uniref:Uncharacterized protein n=1 Tax=Selaginella moellendorffii TaxID=88036 RepID=D8T5U4_SELML|nr:hypothetical protein SELMODRAFT_429335 [Selaginella moellendorffii]